MSILKLAKRDIILLRMTLAFFGLGGIDLLNMVEKVYSLQQRELWIDWIYAQQILPDKDNPGKRIDKYLSEYKGFLNSSLYVLFLWQN
jgi:hypothetical protein